MQSKRAKRASGGDAEGFARSVRGARGAPQKTVQWLGSWPTPEAIAQQEGANATR